ncbi:MAG: spermidine/putrescine ABC transporter substrate-binding protein, partial [Oscillospiraceae bacterium]
PSDYMVSKMASEGLLAELDFANIPNYKMIGDEYKNLAYDPQNKYSVAYTWGLVGVSYNKTMVDKEDLTGDWDLLWNEKYKGQILMFNNSRDAFAIAALMEGLPINPETTEQVSILAEELKEQKPLVQSYVMDEIFDKMEGGEAAIAPYYAGDGVLMHSENSDIEMYIPKSGTNFYVDTVCVLNGSQNKKAAEMYINFLCETEVSVANCEFISYSTPQTVAQKLLPEEMKKSELLYPDKEVMKRATSFVMLSDEVNNAMDNAWSEIRSYEENGSYFIPVLIGVIGLVLVIIFLLKKRKKMKQDY